MQKLVIVIGGASGSVYGKRLLDRLTNLGSQIEMLAVVVTPNAVTNWEIEIGPFSQEEYPFRFYGLSDFRAPFASGSSRFETMIICPCSMGMLGRIAHGFSDNLPTRAADVMLKERRKLILVPRETPYNLIHINNMRSLVQAGATICPASPSFYHKPGTMEEVIDTVIDRVLDLAGFHISTRRWGNTSGL